MFGWTHSPALCVILFQNYFHLKFLKNKKYIFEIKHNKYILKTVFLLSVCSRYREFKTFFPLYFKKMAEL